MLVMQVMRVMLSDADDAGDAGNASDAAESPGRVFRIGWSHCGTPCNNQPMVGHFLDLTSVESEIVG